MRIRLRILIIAVGCLSWYSGTNAIQAAASGNSYEDVIVARNMFGLRPTPEPPPPPNNTPPPPKIILTGITTILGSKTALLKAQLPALKPGEKAHDEFLTLAEGEREGGIEVIEVDEKAARVKVSDYGTIIELAFEKQEANGSAAKPASNAPSANGPINPGNRTIPGRFSHRAEAGMPPIPNAGVESSSEDRRIMRELQRQQRQSNQPLQPQ